MSDKPTPEESGVVHAFIRRHLGQNLSRAESNHAFIVGGEHYKRILEIVRLEREMVAELRLGPPMNLANMTFTEREVELLRQVKDSGRSLADVFSSLADIFGTPPLLAQNAPERVKAGEIADPDYVNQRIRDSMTVTTTDERITLIADVLECIARSVIVQTDTGVCALASVPYFTKQVEKIRASAVVTVTPS